LYNYAVSITKEPSLAEDAVSDVFMKLFEKRNSLMIESSLKSYLFKSVYHQCLNLLKHRRVQDKYRDFFLHHPPLSEDGTEYPLSGVIEHEITGILEKTIEQLPEQCRKIFTMSRIDCMKHEEIAQALGISINTVRTQIHRALEKLRVELKDFL
jgi:RNA polymerase sigma-70 factor (ECF subfamily)